MGFATDDCCVRGELFTLNGKWKYTVTLDMNDLWDMLPCDAVRAAWNKGTPEVVAGATGFHLVVFDPYNKYAHPIMIEV
jgi:hypothetical protein